MSSNEIECQVCHRITFPWEPRSTCPDCYWPIRPLELNAPVFGFDVAVQVRTDRFDLQVLEKHYMTADEKTARRRAKTTPYFVAVLAVRPLTEEQYVRAYGDPRDKSRFS